MKNILVLLCLLIGLNAYGQTESQENSNFEIDEAVKKKVEEKISEDNFDKQLEGLFLFYENPIIVDYYENDSLAISTKHEMKKMLFKSFFYTKNDTVTIDGAFGMFGGFGFSIKFIENKPVIYHMLAADDFPIYSMTKDGELALRIEVPCTNTKLTLSELPKLKEEETIYGIVEFESGEYYRSSGMLDGKEIEERRKIRMNMKIYFKSKFLDIDKMK